ncbi:hypothetical protein SAMN05421848_0933 [Kushneria avicenniae]|uniref:Uncharacterized protein n=1 Tax=Kushneria avicenniae TaxID=402385 RepID=A0A1I1I090_9GAMM|nr:hypothetical protein [Kushneria avicenniae]SFC29737.1 hypothetical protein SAMN05421848_0933 [Kushneria avicenniae]
MIRLERNILDQANNHLRELEDHVMGNDDGDQDKALDTCSQLKALLALAEINDSGMSDECAGMLEEIERRSKLVVSRLQDSRFSI